MLVVLLLSFFFSLSVQLWRGVRLLIKGRLRRLNPLMGCPVLRRQSGFHVEHEAPGIGAQCHVTSIFGEVLSEFKSLTEK